MSLLQNVESTVHRNDTSYVCRFLVDQGCIPPLCELLTVMDSRIVQVALNGLENILRLGEQDSRLHSGTNPFAVTVEECYGSYKKCIKTSLTHRKFVRIDLCNFC